MKPFKFGIVIRLTVRLALENIGPTQIDPRNKRSVDHWSHSGHSSIHLIPRKATWNNLCQCQTSDETDLQVSHVDVNLNNHSLGKFLNY